MFNGTDIKPFEKKVWLASPTMHGEEVQYIKEVYDGSKTSRSLLAKQCDLSENYILKLYKKHRF